MIIEPVIHGVVARSAHPLGCQQAILNQINHMIYYIKEKSMEKIKY